MNFLIEVAGPRECVIRTETQVHTTDEIARRRFAIYWFLIHPESALIRRMWLPAIARRGDGAGVK